VARILIVDDSSVIRGLLSEYLSELGHEVDLAEDGAEGIRMALEGDFHVIFCDIHMPRQNGYQVFLQVSQAKPNSHFVMTDSLPDQLADMATDAGAVCCLQKPFDLDEIKATLEQILSTVHPV